MSEASYYLGYQLGLRKAAHYPGDPGYAPQGGQGEQGATPPVVPPAAPPADDVGYPTQGEYNVMGFPSSRRGARLRAKYGDRIPRHQQTPASGTQAAPDVANPSLAASVQQPAAPPDQGYPTQGEYNVMGFPSSRRGARLRAKYGDRKPQPADAAAGTEPAAAAPNIAKPSLAAAAPARPRGRSDMFASVRGNPAWQQQQVRMSQQGRRP